MKKWVVFIALSLLHIVGWSKINFVEVKEIKTWEEILKVAQAGQKSLFVYVEAYPCPECKALKKTVFKDKDLSKFVNESFISVLIPNFSKAGEAIIPLYNIEEAPHLMVLNPAEDLFYKNAGEIEAQRLLSDLKAADKQVQNYPQWKAAFTNGRIKKYDWINYLLIEHLNGRLEVEDRQVSKVSRALNEDDFQNKTVQQFIMTLGIDPDGITFQALKEKPELLTETSVFSWKNYFEACFDFSLNKAIVAQDSILMEDYLHQLQQLPATAVIPNMKLKGRQFYLADLNLWSGYDSITMQYLRPLPNDSANVYQREALYLMENYVYQTPQKMAMRYLALGLKKKETFELYYTISLALLAEDEWTNAFKAAYNAYQMAKDDKQRKMAASLMNYLDGGY